MQSPCLCLVVYYHCYCRWMLAIAALPIHIDVSNLTVHLDSFTQLLLLTNNYRALPQWTSRDGVTSEGVFSNNNALTFTNAEMIQLQETHVNHPHDSIVGSGLADTDALHLDPQADNDNDDILPRAIMGKATASDFESLGDSQYKEAEFSQMFSDIMDVLDHICNVDFPPSYSSACKYPYINGILLVELYLHDYDDWEICTKIHSCPADFFVDN